MKRGITALRHLFAPIQGVLDHQATTEIVIQRPGEVGVEQHNKWHWLEVPELNFRRLDAISLLAGNLLSKPFDAANPIVETTLPDGQRFTALRPPVTPPGQISITIRRPSTEHVGEIDEPDFAELMENASLHADQSHPADKELVTLYQEKAWVRFWSLAVEAGKSIAAVGPMFSGKTTFLRRVMKKIPPEQRLVTIEDSFEFGDLPLRNRVSFIYGSAGVTAEKLITTSLRMRADRVAMQELRGPEALAYLMIHLAGTEGGFTSWHAEIGDAFSPLALMIKRTDAGRHYSHADLEQMLRSIIDIIAYCHRDPRTGVRTIPHVYFRLAHNRAH